MPRSPKLAPLALAALLAVAAAPAVSAGAAAAPPPEPTSIHPYDLKLIGYVENAHGQLDEFVARLLARLERDLGPREREPITDGRADLQVAKIRVTYAGRTKSPELAALFHQLADAHEARLARVRERLAAATGPAQPVGPPAGQAASAAPAVAPDLASLSDDELDARVAHLISRVRNWRNSR